MEPKNKKRLAIKIIFIVLGVALLFSVISFKLLSLQARNQADQIAGQIINISGNEITIVNKKGDETILILTDQTKVRNNNEALTKGQFIYSFGTKQEDGSFVSGGIRVVKNR